MSGFRVRTSIEGDIKNRNFTEEQHSYLHEIDNNENHHKIAQEILDILIERNMFAKDAMDEAGSILPDGIILRPHGGVFSLGLDRKNNDLPHFIKDQPATSNISITAAGMNTRSNIVLKYGEKTCEFLHNQKTKLEKFPLVFYKNISHINKYEKFRYFIYNDYNIIRNRCIIFILRSTR